MRNSNTRAKIESYRSGKKAQSEWNTGQNIHPNKIEENNTRRQGREWEKYHTEKGSFSVDFDGNEAKLISQRFSRQRITEEGGGKYVRR